MGIKEDLISRLSDNFISTDSSRLAHLGGEFYKGKVRDVYRGKNEMLMITSDRLSAFDVVLTSIPMKGALLNAITLESFKAT